MRTLLKVSPQGQLTLTRPVLQALGNPRHLQAEVRPDRTLLLRPALKMTLDEAAEAFAAEGITREVLTEAFRILKRREKATGAPEPGRTEGV
ncbi:hypothetical protein FK498_15635 [Elioraea sp. Yellowstone]|jgi:hypothetical protein|uniref:hypothetical protein n=1 Tax=Elioraea sp. Yellowstone TaxID=2592070 RepID=UPI00114FB918|nr:hypothetical protein [Elioraea sp. Yellowstone]TQF76844.1 hypothetical protein FK498_15635 [Elioraea sp. Yellowstone]